MSNTDIRPRSAARRLALARLISLAGSSASSVALSWYMWESTGSSAWVAAAFLTGSLVLGLASAPAGALADRVDRRRLMIASDAAAAIVFTALAVAAAMGAPPLLLVVLLGAGALAESPFLVSSQAAIPNLVSDADLPWANAMLGRIQTLASTVAPMAGGALAAALGTATVLGANAASFIASAVIVAGIRVRFSAGQAPADSMDEEDDTPAQRPGRTRTARIAWADPLLRATIFPGFIAFIGVGFAAVATPQLAESYGLGAFGVGLLWGISPVGAFLASFAAQRLLEHGREFRVAVAGFALHGVGLGIVAVTNSLTAALAGLLLLGVGIGITMPARQTIVQRRSADDVRASLFGLMESIGWISFAISGVAAGIFVDEIGLRWSYGVAALLFFAGVLLQLALRGRALATAPVTVEP